MLCSEGRAKPCTPAAAGLSPSKSSSNNKNETLRFPAVWFTAIQFLFFKCCNSLSRKQPPRVTGTDKGYTPAGKQPGRPRSPASPPPCSGYFKDKAVLYHLSLLINMYFRDVIRCYLLLPVAPEGLPFTTHLRAAKRPSRQPGTHRHRSRRPSRCGSSGAGAPPATCPGLPPAAVPRSPGTTPTLGSEEGGKSFGGPAGTVR